MKKIVALPLMLPLSSISVLSCAAVSEGREGASGGRLSHGGSGGVPSWGLLTDEKLLGAGATQEAFFPQAEGETWPRDELNTCRLCLWGWEQVCISVLIPNIQWKRQVLTHTLLSLWSWSSCSAGFMFAAMIRYLPQHDVQIWRYCAFSLKPLITCHVF